MGRTGGSTFGRTQSSPSSTRTSSAWQTPCTSRSPTPQRPGPSQASQTPPSALSTPPQVSPSRGLTLLQTETNPHSSPSASSSSQSLSTESIGLLSLEASPTSGKRRTWNPTPPFTAVSRHRTMSASLPIRTSLKSPPHPPPPTTTLPPLTPQHHKPHARQK